MPSHSSLAAAAGLAVALSAAAAQAQTLRPQTVADAFGLEAAQVLSLDLDTAPCTPVLTPIVIDGQGYTLDLQPHSVRSDDFQVLHEVEAGVYKAVEPGPYRTLRGSVHEIPGSRVLGSMLEDGLHVTLHLPGMGRYWIQPIGDRVAGAQAGDHILYRNSDVIPSSGVCGTDHAAAGEPGAGIPLLDMHALEQSGIGTTPVDVPEQPEGGEGGAAGTLLCPFVTELACDTDHEYYLDYLEGTEDRIELIINTVNQQYEDDVQITHVITAIIVRSSPSDPYSSNSAGGLLDQFRNHWLSQQGGIPRDVAHLFTGRELNGSVIGIAFNIGVICTNQAYCLSQSDCCGSLACATDLTAHELGHLWNGFHCDCKGWTMNPFITCANQFIAGSIATISSHRDSRFCLDEDCPINDECADALLVGGATSFHNNEATTDGPSESGCGGQIQGDIWFRYVTPCYGLYQFTLCGSDFDTTMAIYEGGCPDGPDSAIACNDDDCGDKSRVTTTLQGDTEYLIRIGSASGQAGSGTMGINLLCQDPPDPCPSDLNGDGETDVSDLTSLILAWDSADPDADLNDDGTVGVEDLTILILAWGPC